jgi:hypothetical protein
MTEFTLSDEPPGYALHAWVGGELASHIAPVTG